MGIFRQRVQACAASLILWTGVVHAASAQLPENLPEPPPLPPEMLSKRPMTPPPDLPDPSVLFAQLKQLEELLSLSPERLVSLRQTIEYIERLAPEEREAMRLRLTQITQATPELRVEIARLSEVLPAPLHSNFSQFWLAASQADREALRKELEALDNAGKLRLLTARIETFVKRREEVFARMKATLEERQQTTLPPKP